MTQNSRRDIASRPGPTPTRPRAPKARTADVDIDVLEDQDASMGIDEHGAEYLQRVAQERVGEGKKTLSELYEDLDPTKRAALFASVKLRQEAATSPQVWYYIDRKRAPKNLEFFWMSSFVTSRIGERGWKRVIRTAATVKWCPNASPNPSSRYIEAANGYRLMAMEKDVYLEREIAHASTQNELVEALKEFPGAFSTPEARAKFGLTVQEAQEIDMISGGIIYSREPDLDLGASGSPDMLQDEEGGSA